MNRTHKTFALLPLLLAGVCILWPGHARAGSAPLTRADIETTMAVREKADALRLEGLDRAIREKSGDKESFPEVMAKIQRIGHDADARACEEQGIPIDEYRERLRRLIAVGELVFFEEVKAGMEEELRQRQAKTEADLIKEAEQTRISTEEWFEKIQGSPEANEKGGQGESAATDGYTDSLEQIVMEPMRQQTADGEFVETVRKANQRRIEEIRQQLIEIDQQLSAPYLRQAALDQPLVMTLLDRETLQGLSTSLVEDIPIAALEE